MVAALNPYRQIAGQSRQTAGRPAPVQQRQGNTALALQPPRQVHTAGPAGVETYETPSEYRGGSAEGNPGRVLAQARERAQRIETREIQRFGSREDEGLYDETGTFNPNAFGGEAFRDGLRRAIPDPRQRLFDKKGQLNAHDNRDALKQIAYMLQSGARESRQARLQRAESTMPSHERRQILAAAVQDPEGFNMLAQETMSHIKDLIDYESWTDKVLMVKNLKDGENFRIGKDVRSTAWVIGQDGQGVEARLNMRYVQPSEFTIGSFPTVSISDILQGNYDVLDRAQDTARQEIESEQDKRCAALLSRASATANTVTTFATLGVAAFEDVRYQVERHRLVVEKFLINRAELSDIVKTMSAQVDPVTERELILAGYIGSFLNAMIITTAGQTGTTQEVIPAGTFYAVTGPEYLGVLAVRQDLMVEPINQFAQQRLIKGFAVAKMIGLAISNSRAVAKGVK